MFPKSRLRVGLDFDNTLACYDQVFGAIAQEMSLVSSDWSGSKSEIRSVLRRRPDGERQWQQLQGQVYGKYMHRATIFPEVANFLLRLKQRGDQIFIVSHKTEFGHGDDERIPLRQEAIRWMEGYRFFDEAGFAVDCDNVFFAETRADKIERVAKLRCDVFIDDLWEVFADPNFPREVRRILFSRSVERKHQAISDYCSPSWREISRFVLGEETIDDVKFWIENILDHEVDAVTEIEGRANSQVYRVENRGVAYAVKWYPDLAFDSRPRLLAEQEACEFLKSQCLGSTSGLAKVTAPLNIAIFRWIEGSRVVDVGDQDVESALRFIERLHDSSRNKSAMQIRNAGEACLSENDLWAQIDTKRGRLAEIQQEFPELGRYLDKEYGPIHENCRETLGSLFPGLNHSDKLPLYAQTLSPSDFGFHNALRLHDYSLTWLDFEYFGWDDPAKLILDFLWHPGFSLTPSQQARWIERCIEIFSDDDNLPARLRACWPVYGLRWCLILLNVFLRDESSELRRVRLQKAQRFLEKIKEEHLIPAGNGNGL